MTKTSKAELQPFAFQWHITDTCDQRCKHCYIFSASPGKPLLSMPLEQIPRVLDNCLAFCRQFDREPYMTLTGGDPILHPHIWAILAQLRDRGLDFSVLGNPFHLDRDTCARLADYGCTRYQMSLDGLRETHDWFRKPGSYDCTLDNITVLRDAGIETAIMTTVSSRNLAEIPQLVDVVVEHGVDFYAFARYCPDRAVQSNGISPEQYRALLDTCWHKFQALEDAGCPTVFPLKDHLWALYQYEEGHFRLPEDAEPGLIYSGCNCGNCHMTILPNGDLYACRRLESKVGNALTDSLIDVWLGPMERYREFAAFEKCGKCELLSYCRGCPAVAYSATGSFYGADPQCWKTIYPISPQFSPQKV